MLFLVLDVLQRDRDRGIGALSGLPDGIFSYRKCQFWYILEAFGWKILGYFMAILYFYCHFGKFNGYSVFFISILV
jgi:hypothetical protein